VWAPAAAAAPGGALVLYSSVVIASPKNFWSGAMRGKWALALPADKAAPATLTGNVQITTHHFEQGNFQLRDARSFGPLAVAAAAAGGGGDDGDGEALAAAVVAAIAAAEDDVTAALDAAYEGLSTTVLKELRRFLPPGGSKFNWAAVAQARLVKTLQAKGAAGHG
jgi:hypothetical protein